MPRPGVGGGRRQDRGLDRCALDAVAAVPARLCSAILLVFCRLFCLGKAH